MDPIDSLPIIDTQDPNPTQQETIQRYFDSASSLKRKNSNRSLWYELLFVLLVTFLYVLLSMNIVDRVLVFFPYMDAYWPRLAFKALIFFSLTYVILIFTT